MIARSTALALLLFASAAVAGDWQPDPNFRHELVFRDEVPAPATPAEERWLDSLVAGLKRGGANPSSIHRFARSSATYSLNGRARDEVFVSRETPRIHLVVIRSEPNLSTFVVDKDRKQVGVNVGGSLFLPPSRSFCVVVLDGDWPIAGIPVTGPPGDPSFSDHSVTWY
jgi:hypothetical protein